MHDVFISYSTKNKNVADAVVANFEQHGIKCWYAPRDILPGEEWVSAIREGLNIATIFVLIYTEESNKSRQVMNEVALAFNSGKTLIPFRLTESVMNNELEYYLTRVHWLDAVTNPLNQNINTLREYVSLVLGRTEGVTPILHKAGEVPGKASDPGVSQAAVSGGRTSDSDSGRLEEQTSVRKSKKKIIIPAVIAALVAAVVVGIFIFGGKKKTSGGKSFEVGKEAYYSEYRSSEDSDKALEDMTKAAEKGDADAYYYLGRLAERAYDYPEARKQYEKGVEKDSALAKFGLARLYQNGRSVSADIEQAEKLYNEALDAGATEAYLELGIMAWKGLSGEGATKEADAEAALEYFEKATKCKDREVEAYAYMYMGEVYRLGTGGIGMDMDKAAGYYEKAIETYPYLEGEAKYFLGMGYDTACDDIHADRTFAEAKEFFEKAAAEGDTRSMYYLGNMYRFGFGVKKDGLTAYSDYYKKAAEAGDTDSMYWIAMMYQNGLAGVTVDYEEAYEWFYKAAVIGDGASMKAIGDLYYFGNYGLTQDGEKNYERALYYYEEAVKAGDGAACISLSEMYRFGRGVEKDITKAKSLLEDSIRLGEVDGLYWLGLYYMEYADQDGEKLDTEKAVQLFKRAAESGSSKALNYLGMMYYNGADFASGMDDTEREKTAEEYLIAAAQSGQNRNAFENLGFMYWKEAYSADTEEEADKLFAKALGYYNKAVDLDSKTALTAIGKMYWFGNIGKKDDGTSDYEEAVKWFQKGEEAGDGEAMYYLAYEYLYGTGAMAQDTDKACEKAMVAFDAGYSDASELLIEIAEHYINEDFEYSLASEYDKALAIYNKLIEAGVEDGRIYCRLGYLNYYGLIGNNNYAEAVADFEKSLSLGYEGKKLGWMYGALSRIYYNGAEGIAIDNKKAAEYAEKGSELKDATSFVCMGFLYQDGYYSKDDVSNSRKCTEYHLKGAEAYKTVEENKSVYQAVLGIIKENIDSGYLDPEVLKAVVEELQTAGEISDETANDILGLIG